VLRRLLAPLPVRRAARDVRRLVARHPWLYWLMIGALATWAYATVHAQTATADQARTEWGTTTPVLVATTDLRPGDPLAGAVAVRDWPQALAPPGALAEAPPGALTLQFLAAGDIVGSVDLAPTTGPLALVPEGWVAVPVVEWPASGAAVGDHVQIASEGIVIAAAAIVVGAVGSDVTLVAVPAPEAPLLPLAASTGKLTLLRLP